MKKLLIFALLFPLSAVAQHQVSLSWTPSTDSTTANPGSVSVYRAAGACPASAPLPTFTLLTSTAPAAGPYADTTVTVGQWCYYATFTVGGATSKPSNYFTATVTPGAVTITAAVAQ